MSRAFAIGIVMAGASIRRRRRLVPRVLAIAGVAMACGAQAANLDVHVVGVPGQRGHVRVELCTRTTFLTNDCPYVGVAPAIIGDTVVRVEAPPGEYAVQAFQDETDCGHVHQNLLGIPREPIGFSNDAPLGLSGPRFEAAAVVVGGVTRSITLRLRRLALH
jgi:uncharacterized protein (DUF2141 family)